jgi:hypothetical protein
MSHHDSGLKPISIPGQADHLSQRSGLDHFMADKQSVSVNEFLSERVGSRL